MSQIDFYLRTGKDDREGSRKGMPYIVVPKEALDDLLNGRLYSQVFTGMLKTDTANLVLVPLMQQNLYDFCELFMEHFGRYPAFQYVNDKRSEFRRARFEKGELGGFAAQMKSFAEAMKETNTARQEYEELKRQRKLPW